MSGIAKIEEATLSPSKVDLLRDWLAQQPWFEGDPADVERIGSFRFVDPGGEVGIETLLLRSAGVTYQVPVTYRSEALAEASFGFIGNLEHSVLGTRWVYDAVADPVYVSELLRVIHEGDTEADLSRGEKSATAQGSGIVVARHRNAGHPTSFGGLHASWRIFHHHAPRWFQVQRCRGQ